MFVSATTVKAVFYSVILHMGILILLIVSIGSSPSTIIQPKPDMEIVTAVAVDNQEIEKELQRLREIDEEKQRQQQEAEDRLKAMERQAADAEKKRREEEKRLADARQKQAEERQKREQEQERLAQIKKEQEELEQQRQLEEEKKRREEEDRQRLLAEEQERKEEERKRIEREKALQEQLAEEQRQLAEAQARQDQEMLRSIVNQIYGRVVNNFNKSGLPAGLECVFTVRVIPGGEIINVTLSQSSGNDIFDSRALVALQKASPLPVPGDASTLDRLNLRHFSFRFKP